MIRYVIVALWMALAPGLGLAQEVIEDTITGQADAWERLAQRAESLAARPDASVFAISRLRAELVVYRDQFLDETNVNAGRIATVDAQIGALGTVPEDGEEPAAVAARRAALVTQRADLLAPRLLAQEAHARAHGLISEFDSQLLQQQTAKLTVRGPSPLSPTHLSAAIGAIWTLGQVIWVETTAGLSKQVGSGRFWAVLPRALLFCMVGIVLLGMGRRTVTVWRTTLASRDGRWLPLSLLLLSLVQISVPLLGLLALTRGLQDLGIFGLRGSDIVSAIPAAGFAVIFGWWLARHVFPSGDAPGYLDYDQATRTAGRRAALAIAWVIGLGALFDAGLSTLDVAEGTLAAITWPALVLLGLLFWRLGRAIKTQPTQLEDAAVPAGRFRGLIGQFCVIVGLAGPVLAAFGHSAAGQTLLVSSTQSVALIGVIIILQRLVHDLSSNGALDETTKGFSALWPVFVSFTLSLISLPIFALIWGARVDDLIEIWTRFREGFSLGDTRISPTDFLMFALVFSLGYLLTRLIQGTLRKSVLPRARLDIGAQNAIVAGFGYVGIILAAIFAIMSAGLDLSNLAILAGALSVGIGFGLQTIVSNFVSGIILLIERPVSEGDWIEVAGQMGYVRAISVRSTRIETFDRTDVIIPNADLISGQVTNWTRGNLVGRVIVPVGVAYGSDVEKVTTILRGIAEAHPLVVMSPPPAVLFQSFGADSLDFEIRAILRDVNYVLVAKSEMNIEINKQFAEAGIEIPFAQRDIWLRNPEVLQDTS